MSIAIRRNFVPCIAILLCLAAPMLAGSVNGKWVFNIDPGTGEVDHAVVDFVQKDAVLTGTYTSNTIGTYTLQGVVKGDTFNFSFTTPRGDVHFQGKLDAQGKKITGTFGGGEIKSLPFSGDRK